MDVSIEEVTQGLTDLIDAKGAPYLGGNDVYPLRRGARIRFTREGVIYEIKVARVTQIDVSAPEKDGTPVPSNYESDQL